MAKKIRQEDIDCGFRFDKNGNLMYHPDYHPNHGKPYTDEELEYLCKFYGCDDMRSISFALGRPEASLQTKLTKIKKVGKIEYYKRLNHYVSGR